MSDLPMRATAREMFERGSGKGAAIIPHAIVAFLVASVEAHVNRDHAAVVAAVHRMLADLGTQPEPTPTETA